MRLAYLIHPFACLAAGLLASVSNPAAATSVSPLSVELQSVGRNVVANVQVVNDGARPLPVELVTKALKPTATGFEETDGSTDDLLVVPPSALIQPGQTQAFRVQWIGDPAPEGSRHFYVSVNELPVKLPEGQSALQILYNFNVLVSVGVTGGKAALAISGEHVGQANGKPAAVLTVTNTGNTYDYLSQHSLRILQKDAKGAEIYNHTVSGNEFAQSVGFGLVATGQARTFAIPLPLPTADGTISATLIDERGE